jgi:hypothetical protein
MMRFGTVPVCEPHDSSEKDLDTAKNSMPGRDLSATTLEEAIAEASGLPFPKGANVIHVIDRDRAGLVVYKVWKPRNA